jgi:hypothetical protein
VLIAADWDLQSEFSQKLQGHCFAAFSTLEDFVINLTMQQQQHVLLFLNYKITDLGKRVG